MNNEEIGVLSQVRALLEQQIAIHREIDLRGFGISFHRKALQALVENQRTVVGLMSRLGRGAAWGIPAWAEILTLADEGLVEEIDDAEGGLHDALQSDLSDIVEIVSDIKLDTDGVAFPPSEEVEVQLRAAEAVLNKLREEKISVAVQRNLVKSTGRVLESKRPDLDEESWHFIGDERIRHKTLQCLKEARAAMDAHAHMGALVLLRAVIEAMLVGALLTIEDDARIDFAKRFPGQRREAADAIPTWSIVQLLQVATDNGLISAATSSLCREINRSRNDIHLFSCAGSGSYEPACHLGLYLVAEIQRSLNGRRRSV